MNDDVKFLLSQRTSVVWFLLVAATGLSWSMGSGLWSADPGNAGLLSTVLIRDPLLHGGARGGHDIAARDRPVVRSRVLDDPGALLAGGVSKLGGFYARHIDCALRRPCFFPANAE
jgi:hypothetical protein